MQPEDEISIDYSESLTLLEDNIISSEADKTARRKQHVVNIPQTCRFTSGKRGP